MADHGPRIYLAISSHGYGHLTQTTALMRELIQQIPDTIFRIQCNLPRNVIAERLGHNNFIHDKNSSDVGLIQKDPITPDLDATYQAYAALHENYRERVNEESRKFKNWHTDLVISDIPYLPLAAAGQSGIPGIALASLSWDYIIDAYFDLHEPAPAKWYADACASYRETALALLPAPAMNGHCFADKKHIAPISVPGRKQVSFRSALNIKDSDNRPLILCSLGGIPGAELPVAIMEKASDFHWLTNGSYISASKNLHNLNNCTNWPYKDVIASVDGLIGKPGYGMAVEAAAHGLPFVFFRRGHFPDEPFIIDWLRNTTRSKEISRSDWSAGKFIEPLKDLFDSPAPEPPLCNGAEAAASAIKAFLVSHSS